MFQMPSISHSAKRVWLKKLPATGYLAERDGRFGASPLTLRAAAPSHRLRRRSNLLGLSSPMLSPGQKEKATRRAAFSFYLAERGGFEPPKRGLDAYTLSRRAPSTTRTPLRILPL